MPVADNIHSWTSPCKLVKVRALLPPKEQEQLAHFFTFSSTNGEIISIPYSVPQTLLPPADDIWDGVTHAEIFTSLDQLPRAGRHRPDIEFDTRTPHHEKDKKNSSSRALLLVSEG